MSTIKDSYWDLNVCLCSRFDGLFIRCACLCCTKLLFVMFRLAFFVYTELLSAALSCSLLSLRMSFFTYAWLIDILLSLFSLSFFTIGPSYLFMIYFISWSSYSSN